MPDHYEILETTPDVSAADLKEQWLLLLQAWHPDKFKNARQKIKAQQKTQAINAAYSVLSNKESRLRYDRMVARDNGRSNGPPARNRAGYSVEGIGKACGRYLEAEVCSVRKNRIMLCDYDCIWYPYPDRCVNKINTAMAQMHQERLVYSEVVLAIKNIFSYELFVSFEHSCFIVDDRGNLYKRKYLFCDSFLKNKTRFMHTGEWLRPGNRAEFLLSFPEISSHAQLAEITFHQNLYQAGFQQKHMVDKEVYNISLKDIG